MTQFPIQDNQIQIGGLSLEELAEKVGQTPFYAYDHQVINRQVNSLSKHMPEQLLLHYAIKANPMPALLEHMQDRVDGFDVASGKELQAALNSGMSASDISFAGPGKSIPELQAAVAAGVTINIESATELERIAWQCDQQGKNARVAIRANPDFELKSSGMKMGGGAKPFGVDVEQIPALLQRIHELDLDFQGFHIFAGSQNLNTDSIIEAQTKTLQLADKLAADAPQALQSVNIGGGLGVPYFPGETRLDLKPIGENLSTQMADFRSSHPNANIIMELGRYLVAECGLYVCEVTDIKQSAGKLFLITNGGLHHHLAASGNFGQVIRKNYPVVIGNRMQAPSKDVATVVGPLCTPLDILAADMELSHACIGDLVAVYQSGAYGYTASPRDFLGHPDAKEIFL